MDLEHAKRLADVENRAKSNTRRLDKLEEQTDAINNLATAVQVMATKQDGMAETLDRLDTTVETIKEKPAKRAEAIAEKIIVAIVAALVGAALAHFGL
jgi:hypothetical protein